MWLTIIISAMMVYLCTYFLDSILKYKRDCRELQTQRLEAENADLKLRLTAGMDKLLFGVVVWQAFSRGFHAANPKATTDDALAAFKEEFRGFEPTLDMLAGIEQTDTQTVLDAVQEAIDAEASEQ